VLLFLCRLFFCLTPLLSNSTSATNIGVDVYYTQHKFKMVLSYVFKEVRGAATTYLLPIA
jgi:hypothetical protein